jgi:hypothetical protein
MNQKWKTYEEVATYLLNKFADEFKLEKVEGKQITEGKRSGTSWEIDAKGVRKGNEGFILVECRRYTKSKQNQENVGALAYRILDTGAEGGIIVSPLGIQEGGAKIAESENILTVILDENSTPTNFGMQFLNKLMIGISTRIKLRDFVKAELISHCKICGKTFTVKSDEKICSDCTL